MAEKRSMSVSERTAHAAGKFGAALPPIELSIELFPPKTPEAEARLWRNLELFVAARPRFISVTAVQERFGVPTAAHLTCAFAPRPAIQELAARYHAAGIHRIVALRGDAPKGSVYKPAPDSYAYASDLIAGLREVADFEI